MQLYLFNFYHCIYNPCHSLHGVSHLQKKTYCDSQFGLLMSNELFIMSSLVNLGANYTNHLDPYQSNALHIASRNGELDKVIFMIRLGVDVNSPGQRGWYT